MERLKMDKPNRRLGIMCLLGTALLWSLGGVLIKNITWNSMAIAGGRSLITALVILCFMGKPSFKFTKARIGAIICYAITVLAFVGATKATTAANAILLQYTAPIHTALLGTWLLKERVSKKDMISIGIIMGGMVIFFIDSLKVGNFLGDGLAVLAGGSFGAMHVFMRMEKDNDPLQSTFWGNILAFLCTIPFMRALSFTANNVTLMLFLGVFQLGIAYVLYCKAVPNVSALEMAIIPIIEPILNPVWVMLIQGEKPSVYAVIGGLIVLSGALYKTLTPLKQESMVEES